MHTTSTEINQTITAELYDQTKVRARQFLISFCSTIKLWNERAAGRTRLKRINDHLRRDARFTKSYVEEQANKPFWMV